TPVPRPARGLSGVNLGQPPAPVSRTGDSAKGIPPAAPPSSDAQYAPIPLGQSSAPGRLPQPALPATIRPARSFWQRLVRTLKFWQPKADPVACTLLTPGGLVPGEAVALQVVVHHAKRAEQAKALPDWRGTAVVPGQLERGELLGLHMTVQDVEVSRPLGQV